MKHEAHLRGLVENILITFIDEEVIPNCEVHGIQDYYGNAEVGFSGCDLSNVVNALMMLIRESRLCRVCGKDIKELHYSSKYCLKCRHKAHMDKRKRSLK
jgi:hypothetical protein